MFSPLFQFPWMILDTVCFHVPIGDNECKRKIHTDHRAQYPLSHHIWRKESFNKNCKIKVGILSGGFSCFAFRVTINPRSKIDVVIL